jgi:hypothetical protein
MSRFLALEYAGSGGVPYKSLADCFTESSNDPGNLTSPQRRSATINLLEEDGDLTCTPRLIHNRDIIHIMNTNEIV